MSTDNSTILELIDLEIGYFQKKKPKPILPSINLNIKKGELVCLLGPNGAGKSTLIRTIAGLQKSISGKVEVKSNDIKTIGSKKLAKLISLVLTDRINTTNLTVYQLVAMGRHPHTNWFGNIEDNDKEIILESLKLVGLSGFEEKFITNMSDGEIQRVMIARALAQNTPLIILDEPTAHLDLPNRVSIMNLLKRLAEETSKSILLSTHELDLASQTADTIWLMNKKSKLISGCPEDLILNNEIENTFGGDSFSYDKHTGNFILQYKQRKSKIYLNSSGVTKIWTSRALSRKSFSISEDSNLALKVHAFNNNWLIEYNGIRERCTSIDELLCKLLEMDQKGLIK
ncbi:MAG: ABC transporter ATP-binding protein [Marinifilaceae bacterium]|jgi:iron complex transport system ATP-binding protein|nr:ABC transporter ATP-binding protein [Marinifilaceae bacterium]